MSLMKILNRGLLPNGWNKERMSEKITKDRYSVGWWIVIAIVTGYLFFNVPISEDSKKLEIVEVTTVYKECIENGTEFSEQRLWEYLQSLSISHPHIVFAQARLETGNFTSTIFKENNNLFGMKRAYFRPSTSIGLNRGHAKYKNWKDSVLDFALYKAYVAKDLTEKEYYALLSSSYAEDPLYTNKVKLIANQVLTEWTYQYN